MQPITLAQNEWEASTEPYPLFNKLSYGEIVEEPFRKYGNAIALLEWNNYCIITKIETLSPRTGAATLLLSFLKAIASKHCIRIFGNPVAYQPTSPQAAVSPLSQGDLWRWYEKQGFIVGRPNGVPSLWFPDKPEN